MLEIGFRWKKAWGDYVSNRLLESLSHVSFMGISRTVRYVKDCAEYTTLNF